MQTRCVTAVLVTAILGTVACSEPPPASSVRISGQVEATDVQIAADTAGRMLSLRVTEGDRVAAGDTVAIIDVRDAELQVQRARADRAAADAHLRLLQAGTSAEDIRLAEAQQAAAAADASAIDAEIRAAQIDLDRFEALLAANAGARKQRDDAQARVEVARERRRAAEERVRAAQEMVARARRGSRPQELDAARARVAGAEAQIAVLEEQVRDATVTAPVAGIVTQTLANAGEIVARGAPIAVITDLDRAWANLFVPEPLVPRILLGQAATVFTDAGGAGIAGTVTFISPRAEFTPRNVQTAEERSKLVYRIKVSVDNSAGVLKPGMPVDAELALK
jgi:HlyD family secretion protein